MEGREVEDGMVIEIENTTGPVVLEVNFSREIQHLITEAPLKAVQGTSGHRKILHHSRIMVPLELPQ